TSTPTFSSGIMRDSLRQCIVCNRFGTHIEIHFSPSDFKLSNRTCIKANAIPFFDDAELNSTGTGDRFQSTDDISNEIKEEPMEMMDDPIDELDEIEQPIDDIFCPSSGMSAKFACSQCTKKFISQAYLNKHMIKHSALPKFVPCSKCTKKFVSQEYLNKHMKKHSVSCSKCAKKFISQEDLNKHMRKYPMKEEEMEEDEPGPSSALLTALSASPSRIWDSAHSQLK
ncbi:hypothetical protein PMAYCL1PPCAC_05042, partial [Pristionchus mayeri]